MRTEYATLRGLPEPPRALALNETRSLAGGKGHSWGQYRFQL